MIIFEIPHDGVISIETYSAGTHNHAPQNCGFVYIDLSRIVYARDYSDIVGLVRVDTGVDFLIKKEWFVKLIEIYIK